MVPVGLRGNEPSSVSFKQMFRDLFHKIPDLGGDRLFPPLRNKNPENIKVIDEYALPSDEFLARQGLEGLVCDTMCMYNEQCCGICIAPDGWKDKMIDMLLHSKDHKAV